MKMKKYKLKKWYPSLNDNVREGCVATINHEVINCDESHPHYNYYRTDNGYLIDPKEVENNPDFWGIYTPLKAGQLVYRVWPSGRSLGVLASGTRKPQCFDPEKEASHFYALEDYPKDGGAIKKDFYEIGDYEYGVVKSEYEILTVVGTAPFFTKVHKVCDKKVPPYTYKPCWDSTLYELLEDGIVTINSVKRLSDGKVFTVKDKVVHSTGKEILINTIDLGVLGTNIISFNKTLALMSLVQHARTFELLSFYTENKPEVIINMEGRGTVTVSGFISVFTSEEILKNKNFTIHSIRRLSDGEVFTEGDVITNKNPLNLCRTIIKSLQFGGGGIIINGSKDISFSGITKCEDHLFITTDGVKLFEGDTYYYTTPSYTVSSETLPSKSKVTAESWENLLRYSQSNNPKFSTEDAAKEHVHLNEPKLSIQDILNISRSFPDSLVIKRSDLENF